MKKNVITAMILIFLLCFSFNAEAAASNIFLSVSSANDKADSRAEIYEWRFKLQNGKLYKRLYNCTRHEWAGDWILIE